MFWLLGPDHFRNIKLSFTFFQEKKAKSDWVTSISGSESSDYWQGRRESPSHIDFLSHLSWFTMNISLLVSHSVSGRVAHIEYFPLWFPV